MAKSKSPASNTNSKKVSTKISASSKEQSSKFLIVGIGASAGGLQAYQEFFSTMPNDPGMAFVLIQHLDPTHKSLLADLLKKHTQMPVEEVKDNTKVQPNKVYIIPPNKDMAILNGSLHLMEPTVSRGFRRPIDFFLRSLAEDQRERAVGIILSGTGTEGTLSLKDIKGQGGLAVVQDPETAKYDGMPRSVIAAGIEDFILPANEIPNLLIKYKKNRKFKPLDKVAKPVPGNDLLEKIFILLRNETGCNFSEYKSSTVVRRIEKRMALNQIDKLDNYIKFLQKNSEEILKLFKELLIGVTSFFRDTEAFDFLQQNVIPQIIETKSENDIIRIWVPGCSTGEEAYSIAVLFDEVISKQKKQIKVQIFASDLDENAINYARQGIYPETISVDVGASRLAKYFKGEPGSYRIKKEIRDQIIFAQHNLIKDPPFSKQDMISCRNLLIYLNLEAQKKVFSIFHYALKPDGILLLGSSESLGDYARVFEVVDRKAKIFKHKDFENGKLHDIGYLFKEPPPIKQHPITAYKRENQESLAEITEKLLLKNYAPACAIIDSKNNAVYFAGNTGKYLQPSPGEASLNIVDMARDGLKIDLRTIIAQARKSKKKEVRSDIKIKTGDAFQVIDLCIQPVNQTDTDENYLMITFEDKDIAPEKIADIKISKTDNTTELHALEQELVATKEYLRSTIEELEVSNEELKSSNEELQSSNEELQSTNEEMETSKEELQSVNEEIITVNTELQTKIDELGQAYDDMNNLLASTAIGTIFLDSNLKIKRFTPTMAKIINLIETDIGRPIEHLSSQLIYSDFVADVNKVLHNLTPLKTAVKAQDGTWYQMRIMPYRTSENVIEGVVITFVDITQEKLMEEELKDFKEQFEHLLKMTKTIVYTQDKKLQYTSDANLSPDFQYNHWIGKKDSDFYSTEDAKRLETIKKKVLKTGKPIRQIIPLTIGGIQKFHDLMVRPIYNETEISGIACISIDITELTEAEKQLKQNGKEKNGH